MNQDIYSYLQQLHIFIEAQERRIIQLEKRVKQLEKQTNELKSRPPINVDRIEYKFDQLKVESLDGTLNIGLNPSDLQGIEDFAINNQGMKTPFQPKVQFQRSMEIEDEIIKYLEGELPKVVEETARSMNLDVDENHLSFIKEDIKKQLPNRIDFYLKQQNTAEQTRDEHYPSNDNQHILNKLISEIKNGVQIFLSHLENNSKGMKNE